MAQTNKLSISRTIKISLAFAWISLFNIVFDTALPLILMAPVAEGGLNLSHTLKGVVMALDNILGLFLLPLFGFLSDKTNTKVGKRTPYIIIGGLLAVVAWILAGLALDIRNHYFFLVALGVGLAFIAMSRPAALSLLPDLTSYQNRRKANALTQIISIVATLVGLAMLSIVTPIGFGVVFYSTAAVMLVLIVIFIFTVKEKKWQTQLQNTKQDELFNDFKLSHKHLLRNRLALYAAIFFFYVSFNGLTSSLSNYATQVLNLNKSSFAIPQLLCLIAACVAAVPVSKLQKRFKRRTLLVVGFCIMLGAFSLAYFQASLNAWMYISFILAGTGYSIAIVNLYPYILEISDPDKVGRSTGIFNMVMTVAMVITPILSGVFADKWGLYTLFPYCIVALILSLSCLMFIKDLSKTFDKKA